jgi:tetratricopeptide (TPR) repeat protein
MSGGGASGAVERDFFVSYTGSNDAWARWIAVELERAGYSTVSQALDFGPGQDFVHEMHRAVSSAVRTIAVLSPAYLASGYSEAEWRAALADDPTGELGRLVPVMVQPCSPPGLLRARIHIDLVDVDEAVARRRLLDGVAVVRPRPTAVRFPGRAGADPAGSGLRFPGAGPEISNLPPRNRNFAGRTELLELLHARLQATGSTGGPSVAAVHGLGGIGKTELAREYGHRFAGDFDIVWSVSAEEPTTAAVALAGLARRLGMPPTSDPRSAVEELLDLLRGRDRWLLIYDNAEEPSRLEGLFPSGGGGSVLVTSRWSAWSRWADPARLDVLSRAESVEFLTRRSGSTEMAGLAQLAELLGDLPLALEEAAAYLEATGVALVDYLALVRERMRDLFALAPQPDRGARRPGVTDRRVASVWSVSLDQVRAEAPAAEQVLALCAVLGPEVPRALLVEHADVLPDELADIVRDPIACNAVFAALGRYSLAAVGPFEIGLHRLVQAVIRARLSADDERHWARVAVRLVNADFESGGTSAWPAFERILPHLLAAAGHAERLGVAGVTVGPLFGRAASYLFECGHYRQAVPLARHGLEATEAALGSAHLDVGARCDELGRALLAAGEPAAARAQLERALQIGVDLLGADHPEVGDRHNDLGWVLQELGDLAAARQHYERALAIGVEALGPGHPDVGTRRSNLGLVLREQGDLAAARREHELALRIGVAALGEDHPDVGLRRNNLGLVLRDQGDLTGALDQYRLALSILGASLGAEHPRVVLVRNNLGSALRVAGDPAAAQAELERALRVGETALGPDHPEIATLCNNLALALHDQGHLDRARVHYERALRVSESVFGAEHPILATRRTNLGNVLRELGDPAGARRQYELALAVSERTLGSADPRTLGLRNALHLLADRVDERDH